MQRTAGRYKFQELESLFRSRLLPGYNYIRAGIYNRFKSIEQLCKKVNRVSYNLYNAFFYLSFDSFNI